MLGHPEWAADPRFANGRKRAANRAVLVPLIAAVCCANTGRIGSQALEAVGVPCAPVNNIGELAASEQFAAMDMKCDPAGEWLRVVGLPINFDRKRPWSATSAPKLGEHTEQILKR